ncbi:MAG: PAS domain S-box protein [Bermanella sp.]
MLSRILCLFSWLLFSTGLQASTESIQVESAYLYSEQPLSFSTVQSQKESSWHHVSAFGSHGFLSGEFWLRTRLQNTSDTSQSVVLRFTYPSHDEVDFYELDKDARLLQSWQMGDMRDQSDLQSMDKHPAIKVNLSKKEEKWVYARVKSMNTMVLNLDIFSEKEHQNSIHLQTILSGLIYGVLLVMALYNFVLAVSMRDKAYYVYVLYVVTFLSFVLVLNGDGYFYLWSDFPELNQMLLPILAGFLIIPSLAFPYYLLDIKKQAPSVMWVYRLSAIVACTFLLMIPVLGIAKSIILVNALSVALSISMLAIGLYLSFKKIPFARTYTLAWFILLLGLAVLSLASLGVIDSNLMTRNAGLLGGVAEVIILSLVLSQHISQERNAKLQAVKDAMRNRKLFQELFDQAPIGIVRFDLNGTIVTINPMLTRMLGFKNKEQALEQINVLKNVITNHKLVREQLIENKKVLDKQMELRTAVGDRIPCSVSLHFYEESGNQYIEAYITDIRERIEAQNIREYMEQERLASIEQLVTGVAHEINTPLGVNITSVSHIKEIIDEVDGEMERRSLTRNRFVQFISDSQQLLEIVTHNLQKISNLVRRFKLVSVSHADKVMMNLKQHLELSLHSHLFIGQDVEIELNCDNDVNIQSYPAAWNIIIEQLIENSMVHGFTPEQGHKKITIYISQFGDNEWRFDYKDNGQGLTKDLANRVFDPFVTTKRGSSDHAGLGLYRIFNLVHRVFEGEVVVKSGPGFHLTLIFQVDEETQTAIA